MGSRNISNIFLSCSVNLALLDLLQDIQIGKVLVQLVERITKKDNILIYFSGSNQPSSIASSRDLSYT